MLAEWFKTNGGRDKIKDLRKAEDDFPKTTSYQVHSKKIINTTDEELEQILKDREALYEMRERRELEMQQTIQERHSWSIAVGRNKDPDGASEDELLG